MARSVRVPDKSSQETKEAMEWAFRRILLGCVGLVGVLVSALLSVAWYTIQHRVDATQEALTTGQNSIIIKVDAMTTRIGLLDTQFATAKSDIGSNSGKIDMLQNRANRTNDTLQGVLQDVAVLKQQVGDLKAGRR